MLGPVRRRRTNENRRLHSLLEYNHSIGEAVVRNNGLDGCAYMPTAHKGGLQRGAHIGARALTYIPPVAYSHTFHVVLVLLLVVMRGSA